jgi:hypothetical protein
LCEVHFTLVKMGLTCRFSLRLCVLLLHSYFFLIFAFLPCYYQLSSILFFMIPSFIPCCCRHLPPELSLAASRLPPCWPRPPPTPRDHSMVELGRDSRGRRGGREAVVVATPGDLRPRFDPCLHLLQRVTGRAHDDDGRWAVAGRYRSAPAVDARCGRASP